MREHSVIGLVTNSSTEVFVIPKPGIEDRMRDVGEKMLAAFGISKSFDEVFEIRRSYTDSFYDFIVDYERYGEVDWIPAGFNRRIQDAQHAVTYPLLPEDQKDRTRFYDLPNWKDIRDARNKVLNGMVDAEIDISQVPVSRSTSEVFIEFSLVVKETGKSFDFDAIYGSMYETETEYC